MMAEVSLAAKMGKVRRRIAEEKRLGAPLSGSIRSFLQPTWNEPKQLSPSSEQNHSWLIKDAHDIIMIISQSK